MATPPTIQQVGAPFVGGSTTFLRLLVYAWESGQISVNRFQYLWLSTTGTGATYGDIAWAFNSLIQTTFLACMANTARFLGCKFSDDVKPLINIPGVTYDGNFGTYFGAGATLPTVVCGILSKQTNIAGPGGRGRNYMPFPAASASDSTGAPVAGYQSAVESFGFAALGLPGAGIVTVTGLAGNIYLFQSIIHHVGGGSSNISDCAASGLWASQRRRGGYGRLNRPAIIV